MGFFGWLLGGSSTNEDKEKRAWFLVASREWDKASKLGAAAVGPLINAIGSDDSCYVKEALVKIGAPAVEPLITVLRNNYLDSYYNILGWNAAEALGKIGDKRAVEPLTTMLRDGYSNNRGAAVEALKKLGYRP